MPSPTLDALDAYPTGTWLLLAYPGFDAEAVTTMGIMRANAYPLATDALYIGESPFLIRAPPCPAAPHRPRPLRLPRESHLAPPSSPTLLPPSFPLRGRCHHHPLWPNTLLILLPTSLLAPPL